MVTRFEAEVSCSRGEQFQQARLLRGQVCREIRIHRLIIGAGTRNACCSSILSAPFHVRYWVT